MTLFRVVKYFKFKFFTVEDVGGSILSFLKKLAEKVTPPKVSLKLNLSGSVFYLGDDIKGELTVISYEDFDAEDVRCEIRCVESAKVQKRFYDHALKREVFREVWESTTLYSANPSLSGPIHISQGFSSTFPFSIPIPVTMKPTSKGLDRRVTWTIKGVVAIKGRPDAVSPTLEIQVAQPVTTPVVKEREVIREVVMVPCKYCGTLFPQTETICPHCGARRTI
ncbi:MAG: hypothetical protein QXQ20_02505 [Candidatus Nezhaarchaeales archaeon]|nr:MAG: hypothetical protein DSO05_04200 [Candidatus Nezhaarchaeota archaeon WYZ-LMO7]TDA36349.1 MAG: hypothetical protein DSO06_00535 [Candidatus Nezhaarchaeota archaeon WYZ-LMO8]